MRNDNGDKPLSKAEKTARAADLFKQAAANIEQALILLDTSSKKCGECSTVHWIDQLQARIYQQYTDTPHKLRGTADRLEVRSATTASTVKK